MLERKLDLSVDKRQSVVPATFKTPIGYTRNNGKLWSSVKNKPFCSYASALKPKTLSCTVKTHNHYEVLSVEDHDSSVTKSVNEILLCSDSHGKGLACSLH